MFIIRKQKCTMIGEENQIRGTFLDKWNLLRKCGGIISTKIIFQGTLKSIFDKKYTFR